MTCAAERLFDTYELFEHILLYLTPKELFGVRRVSVTWKRMLSASKPVQKRMFLLADGAPLRPDPRKQGRQDGLRLYPGVLRLNPIVAVRHEVLPLDGARDHGTTSTKYAKLVLCRTVDITRDGRYLDISWFDLRGSYPEYLRPDISCNDMFFTQPPVTQVEYRIASSVPGSFAGDAVCNVWNPAGVRFRDVWPVIERARRDFSMDASAASQRRTHGSLKFWMAFPLVDPDRMCAYEACTFPFEEIKYGSCACTDVLFAPPEEGRRSG